MINGMKLIDTFVGRMSTSPSRQASILFAGRFGFTVFMRGLNHPSIEFRITFRWIGIGFCAVWFGALISLWDRKYNYKSERAYQKEYRERRRDNEMR